MERVKLKVINNYMLSRYIYEKGYNNSELSRATNISRSTIENIVSGKNHPSYTVINILAETLKMTENIFLEIFFPSTNFKEDSKD